MQIKGIIKLGIEDLTERQPPEHLYVRFSSEGNIEGLNWRYESSDFKRIHEIVKRRGGTWDSGEKIWKFRDEETARGTLDAVRKKHPDWPIISNGGEFSVFLPLKGVRFLIMELGGDKSAGLLPNPLPYFSREELSHWQKDFFCVSLLSKDEKKPGTALVVGETQLILDFAASLKKQGAIIDSNDSDWNLNANSKLKIEVSGWAVRIVCDLANPLHYLIMPSQKYKWVGKYPNGVRTAIPWDGTINITRKLWPIWKERIEKAGLQYEGDDPQAEIALPVEFTVEKIPGWNSPASNGHILHDYQREGVLFCLNKGMKALIGDEMGIGKTAQAIAAAEAVGAKKILVICPANARYVWDREIKGWGSGGDIQHISDQLDQLDSSARWHIVTYDQIVSKTETWRLQDEQEEAAFLDVFPERKKDIVKKSSYPRKLSISEFSSVSPAFSDVKRLAAWQKMMRRLQGELLDQILATGPLLMIVDEAHRAKNRDAKRTKAIRRLSGNNDTQILLLTGTPLRNNEHEAAVLLGFIDAEADYALDKKKGYTIQDVKDYLNYFMIRRTKEEVLSELPEKIRQRIDIDQLDRESLESYWEALSWARKTYLEALKNGKSEAEAKQIMQGGIEKARTFLGVAKILGGEVSDLVSDIVENKDCCVVFCAHHEASDKLMSQLQEIGIKSAVVDGRTPQIDRAKIVDDFQNGNLQVFIGGINSAGEAITLTRADTVVFAELDWVPAALLQAEDRIHRVGQKSNCQVIQLIAKIPGDNLDETMISILGSKMEKIGRVLDEGTDNIIGSKPGSIHKDVIDRLLSRQGQNGQQESGDLKSEGSTNKKRKRGRPKVYVDQVPPSATERSKLSVQNLKAKGGKRLMLRITPEALDALKTIMDKDGFLHETEAINQTLISRKKYILNMPTEKMEH